MSEGADGSLSRQSEDVSRQSWGQTRQDTHPHADQITRLAQRCSDTAAGSEAARFSRLCVPLPIVLVLDFRRATSLTVARA